MNEVLHKFSRTQLVMIAHGSRINYKRGKIMAELESEREKDSPDDSVKHFRQVNSPVGKKFDTEPKEARVFKTRGTDATVKRSNRGPAMGKVTAEEYRAFMRSQGIKFKRVD